MEKLLINIMMWYMHRLYTKCGLPIYEIKGTGKDYPKHLVYVETESLSKRLSDI